MSRWIDINDIPGWEKMKERNEKDETSSIKSKGNFKPKVFISHKTSERKFAEAIIKLIEALGLNKDQIFCSSIPGYGVKANKDFIEVIKEQYQKYKTFIIVIHSKEYYESPICMNELGAAFLANSELFSFLTKDCDFQDLKGVIKPSTMMFKVNNKETYHLLDVFITQIQTFFNLTPISEKLTESIKDKFLVSILS